MPHFVRWVKRMFAEELLTRPTSLVGGNERRRIANAPHFLTRGKEWLQEDCQRLGQSLEDEKKNICRRTANALPLVYKRKTVAERTANTPHFLRRGGKNG